MRSFSVTDVLNIRWKISDQAIANTVGDEVVVLHLANGTYYGLDPVGSILWEALGQGDTPAHACEQILARYDVDRETVERDLRQFIDELAEGDLIVAA
jgi:Coenzyme PQQ synthesis protein D (PqqD)